MTNSLLVENFLPQIINYFAFIFVQLNPLRTKLVIPLYALLYLYCALFVLLMFSTCRKFRERDKRARKGHSIFNWTPYVHSIPSCRPSWHTNCVLYRMLFGSQIVYLLSLAHRLCTCSSAPADGADPVSLQWNLRPTACATFVRRGAADCRFFSSEQRKLLMFSACHGPGLLFSCYHIYIYTHTLMCIYT